MALFDTNSGLGNLFNGMNIFGASIPTGILDPQQEEKLRNQALISGVLGTAANYLAQPKNLNTGSALPYLAKAYASGMGSSQGTVDTALNNLYRQQLVAGRNDPFGTIDISKFTPESISEFQKTKDYGVLKPISQARGTNIGNIDPTKFTPESLATYQQSGNLGDLKQVSSLERGESPFGKINTSDYTPKSLSAFQKSGNFEDLVPKPDAIKATQDYTEPQLDQISGKYVFLPKRPGLPIKDLQGNIVTDVKLPEKAGEKLTEGERTAGFLSERLNNSLNQLKQVTGEKPSAASPNVKAEAIKFFTRSDYLKNLANPESRQQVEAAQYDILDSALTLGTGAAYTREQLESYRQSYFPQLGDKPKTVADKAKRLEGLLDAAYKKSGRAAPKEAQSQPSMTMPSTQGWSIKKKSGG
jgi:hypothetical protein